MISTGRLLSQDHMPGTACRLQFKILHCVFFRNVQAADCPLVDYSLYLGASVFELATQKCSSDPRFSVSVLFSSR